MELSANVDGEERVIAAAQKIVKSLNTSKNDTDDMILIFSNFDNRLSSISDRITGEARSQQERLDSAKEVIQQLDSSFHASPHSLLFEDSPDKAMECLYAVDALIQLVEDLSVHGDIVDQAEGVIQQVMLRLEDEFRGLLFRNSIPLDADQLYFSIRRISLSFTSRDEDIGGLKRFAKDDEDGCYHEKGGSLGENVCADLIDPDIIVELKEIADRMVRSGYEKECCQVYSSVRRDALEECLLVLGIEKLSIEEVQKIEWSSLDEKMKKWIQALKITVKVVLYAEKNLCDQIFSGSELIKEICFSETVKGCVMQLLNFAEAVTICPRSSEKLFRILEMYDALSGVMLDLKSLLSEEDVVFNEARGVLAALGDAARGAFVEFEKAVEGETSKKPPQSVEVHPLPRYVMNYTKLIIDVGDSLNTLLVEEADYVESSSLDKSHVTSMNVIGYRLQRLISSLESNLVRKSKLYEDASMQYIFLLNNILYIVNKVKDSELSKILGDDWVRKRRGQVRQYATSYHRASWSKALSCLKDEGIGGSSSNPSKVALKERFKNFNACFEDIYRIQTAWKVPDQQLREELQLSIAERVIPAYRSFMGRFGCQLENLRHSEKYIKYAPEDIEKYLLDFFEGSPCVLHHMKKRN